MGITNLRAKATLIGSSTIVALSTIAYSSDTTSSPSILDGEPYGRSTAEEHLDEKTSKSEDSNQSEFTGIPALFSTPETGIGAGGALVYLGPKLKSRRNFLLAGATFTEKRQFLTAGVIEIFDPSERFSFETHFKLTRYPDFFFGVGNRTELKDKDLYTMRSREIGFTLKIAPDFNPKHQLGLGIHQEITEFDQFSPDGILSTNDFVGKNGGLSRSLTASWQYQNNDEDFDPHKGLRISWDLYRSSPIFGSEYENLRFWSNNAVFLPLNKTSTLALQIYGQFSKGTVPWYHLAQTGGTNLLRGYFMGRFRDQQLLVSQAEIRRHLFRRIGIVGFAAIGQVAPRPAQLLSGAPLAAWGGGLRYRLTKNQRINARLDVGFNRSEPKTPNLYLYILEAF